MQKIMNNDFRKKYAQPPLQEVVCEFIFESKLDLEIKKIIELNEAFKKDFPNLNEMVHQTLTFKPTESGVEKLEVSKKMYQFFDENNKSFVQFSNDLFAINKLAPYEGWEGFKPKIKQNLEKYLNVVNHKIIKRIILKYINRIDISEERIKLPNYFNYYPETPEQMSDISSFSTRIEIPYKKENQKGKELITIESKTVKPIKENIKLSILLDIQYAIISDNSIDFDFLDIALENAHTEIEKNFELCITEKSREAFKVEN